jgi:hypothetical protein
MYTNITAAAAAAATLTQVYVHVWDRGIRWEAAGDTVPQPETGRQGSDGYRDDCYDDGGSDWKKRRWRMRGRM